MPIYPYSFQLPPLSTQDIPNNGAVGEFLGISAGGVLDWLPVASGGGDLLAANNLSELTATASIARANIGAGVGNMLKSENLSGLASYPTARTNLGLGTTDTPTFKNLVISTGSIATSAPVTISQTWDALAVAFTAFKVNATSTNSASGSLLLDLQVGGVSKASFTKDGVLVMGVGGGSTMGDGSNGFLFRGAGVAGLFVGQNGSGLGATILPSNGLLSFSSSTTPTGASSDTILVRDGAANTLALRNSTNAQTFNLYGTYTSITDYKRLTLTCATTGVATIEAPLTTSGLTITAASWNAPGGPSFNNRATITFATQVAAFPVGSTVVITGVTPAGYNGTYTVTASTLTTISYLKATNPGTYASGGAATVTGTSTLAIQGTSLQLKGVTGGVANTAINIDSAAKVAIGAGAPIGGSIGSVSVTIANNPEIYNGGAQSGIIVMGDDALRYIIQVVGGTVVATAA